MHRQYPIAIIGGTGKSGQYLVKQLIAQGFSFKLLLRNPDKFTENYKQVEVIKGDVTSYEAVYSLVKDSSAVISMLGLSIPASEPTIFSTSTAHIIKAMNTCGINRYLVTTGLNVDTPFDNKGKQTAMATEWMKNTYPTSTANKQQEYEMLVNSTINYTLVRLPVIEQTGDLRPVLVSETDCPGTTISATSLAHFLIEQLSSEVYNRKSPFIADAWHSI